MVADIFDQIDSDLPPQQIKKSGGDVFDQIKEPEEGWGKWAARTALQVPQGIAEATPAGIGASIFQLLALGESDLDPEEWNKLRGMYAEKGIDFDEAYEKGRQEMLQSIPTIGNIAKKVEEETGLPLEPKTALQKGLRLGSSASKFTSGSTSQKAIAGVTAPLTSKALQEAGVPEPISDVIGLGIGTGIGQKSPAISIGKQTKESGISKRGFESLEKPREVSQSKINKINDKIQSDFKEISNKIIEDSSIGSTAKELAKNPSFKQESRELLSEAKNIADTIKETTPVKSMKKEIMDYSKKETKGFIESEYDKSYSKYMNDASKDLKGNDITASQLVDQYRKNNSALSEYFEPGASKALNRAKRDALLDQNKVIANVLEKSYPESELSPVFKQGNERWTKIMDAEAVDGFVNEMFKDGVNYKKMHDFFDKNGYDRVFKRALGEKGYKDFEILMKDMLSNEAPYKMLKVAKNKGYENLFSTGMSYILHPKLGIAKSGWDLSKSGFKALLNYTLDKPKLIIEWKSAIDTLKKGDFKKAETKFEALKKFNEHKEKQIMNP